VDILHLLEDLRDAYPGALEETILTEIVANSLDSGATLIALTADPAAATLTVTDDGTGMKRSELIRFHDIAATTKTRGQGIGFAGVGIKLGLLACHDVLTETRRGKHHVASSWCLASRRRAPWKWVPPPGLVADHGTAVRLKLREPLSALLDTGFLEATIARHFEPLLDVAFDQLLAAHYPAGVRFLVNGHVLPRREGSDGRAALSIRVARKRKPSAVGFLTRDAGPLPEERRGVAVSTLGKVIKRGWGWLGLVPAAPDRIGGLVEVPALAECLTLDKGDFIRAGQRGMTHLAYRKAIQQAVTAQLAAWGEAPGDDEEARRRKTRPLERDLHTVLVDLAEEFPLLAMLVERQAGGQRRLPMGRAAEGARGVQPAALGVSAGSGEAPELGSSGGEEEAHPPEVPEPGEGEAAAAPAPEPILAEGPPVTGGRGPKRPVRYGLTVRFEKGPDGGELGRLVESTVWVNESHPAYRRALASRSEGYHVALTVAMALAPLAVEPPHVHGFVTAFLTRWGAKLDERVRPGRRRH
ncbi:MAG: ATP-binding protein, partial [Gemmatimonadales bacterium]|nr:ATP-binding protein [Gemmatimonadales bacterium]